MSFLSNIPDYILIRNANKWIFPMTHGHAIDNLIDTELDSRVPVFEPEYDATGQIIISEVMGYTEEGEEIWS